LNLAIGDLSYLHHATNESCRRIASTVQRTLVYNKTLNLGIHLTELLLGMSLDWVHQEELLDLNWFCRNCVGKEGVHDGVGCLLHPHPCHHCCCRLRGRQVCWLLDSTPAAAGVAGKLRI